MLSGIVDGIKEILSFFRTLFDFVVKFFGDLVYMIKLMGDTITKLPEYFAWLPSAALSMFTIMLTIIIVYKVLGRD